MYKLVNTGKAYELHQHDSTKYEMVCKLKSVVAMHDFVEKHAPRIQLRELEEALRFMVKENHNTAEFGYNGTFTVSYLAPIVGLFN